MKRHFLLNEVAKIVGCKGYQIQYAIANGKIDEPTLRINNKRVFTNEDVARVRELFRAKKAKKEAHEK
jgi:DNA-binding transcriptional MerR regulator